MLNTSRRRHILQHLGLAAALGLLSLQAFALEGFRFIAEHTLTSEKPVCMAAVADDGLVVYDAAASALQFFNASLEPGRQVLLKEAVGADVGTVAALTFDPSRGEILALDAKRNKVYAFDLAGALIETINLDITGPVRLDDPTDLAVDQNGLLCIADPGDGNVKVFTRQGIYLVDMRKLRDAKGKRVPFKPTGVSLLQNGSVVAMDMEEGRVQTFSRDGVHRFQTSLEGDSDKLKRLLVTRDGDYISLDHRRQKVCKWTSAGKQVALFGTKGTGRGGFLALADVACNSRGEVITLDSKLRRIQIFSFETPSLALEGDTAAPAFRVASTQTEVPDLLLVAMLPEGLVFFDPTAHTVHVRNGEDEQVFEHAGFEAVSTACICDGYLYVFDRGNHTVFAFRSDTRKLEFTFGAGRGAGSLDDVVRILPGAANTLYLADQDDTLVKIYSRDGIYSTSFGDPGLEDDQVIGHLTDIAWYRGRLAVLDRKRKRIHLYDTNGRYQHNIKLRLPEGRTVLAALGVDPNGFLTMLDAKQARVLVVNEDGKVTYQFGSRGRRPHDWDRPSQLLIERDGSLKVFDRGTPPRLLTYSLQTPGALNQAATALAARNHDVTAKHLEPFIASLEARDATPSAERTRALALALRADLVFSGFLSDLQRETAQTVLDDWITAHPESPVERLALAESLHADGRVEDAIALLRVGQAQHPDARTAALLTAYKGELDTSGDAQSIVSIKGCEIPPLLAALSQNYYDHPVIKLTVANAGGKPTPAGVATFFAKAVMDDPTETPVPALPPFSTRTFHCRATFNRNILSYVETTRLSAHVEVRFGKAPNISTAAADIGFELQGRNSIDWKQEGMIACFITPKDPDIQVFLRRALNAAEDQTIQADLDQHLYKALTLFDAMQSVDMIYAPDPTQPFNYARLAGEGLVDYVQYPRETLLRLSGDCDDLAVLYASLLEGAGIPTVLVTSPGHIFVAFALKNGKQAVDALGLEADRVVEFDGQVFVPVETALLGNAFVSAWRVAANTIARLQPDGDIGFIDIKKAWQQYKTVSLPPHDREVPLPTRTMLGVLLRRELDALNLKQVEKRLAIYKQWLEREPKNIQLMILLARSYGEVGVFDLAQEYADRAKALAPDNPAVYQMLGNLSFLQNEFAAAATWFLKADKLSHTAAIQVNLALTYLKDGKLVLARKAYAEAKKLDADLVNGYPELVQLLD